MRADDMPLSKEYEPDELEQRWYEWWLKRGLFHAEVDEAKEPFSMVIPPPNVTGSLHMGHALNNTLQDIVCRYKRMRGFNVLWIPGTDHAGIATQNVVERELAKSGIQRKDMTREAFLEKVWEWKSEYGGRIISQLKRLGASCDWSRERFTMDEGLSRAVRCVFVRLYEEGLIYKGKYIINWCPRCHTALSDLEVEHALEKGKLYYVAYPIEGETGFVVVATTRPETILGDVAIAVHPDDPNNSKFVGKRVKVPMVDRIIPVIEDEMVDPSFGTGMVKITPAHDPNDFLVGQRHGLEPIQVIDADGFMNENAGRYRGMSRFQAREAIVKDIEAAGLLVKIEEHEHAVGHCYRCNTVLEPFLSEQWFVRTEPLAKKAIEVVREGKIRWIPERWVNTYYQWMENIRDWCISRQLWWGHRIPAWTCKDCGHITVSEEDPTKCGKCGSGNIVQDEDVLDTWFSSALWPFSTMGWPEDTPELRYFYPTSLLVTGFDIIFFWVARMIMMGLKFMGDVPFKDVYIHALVRDEKGQKMSKSKGNVIDPLDVIAKYGADSLRFTLSSLTVQGRDIYLSTQKIESYRHFMNKIWNAGRFALMNLGGFNLDKSHSIKSKDNLRLHDKWILLRINQVVKETTELLEGYFFGEASRLLYDFVWGELCDWYIEMAKPALKGDEGDRRKTASQQVLGYVFRKTLLLLHPFIPFITEELWHAFGFSVDSIEEEPWPSAEDLFDETTKASIENEMYILQETIRSIRNLRAEANLAPQMVVPHVVFSPTSAEAENIIARNEDMIKFMTKVGHINVNRTRPGHSLVSVLPWGNIYLVVGEIIDIPSEIERLKKERESLLAEEQKSLSKLSNESFLQRAPKEVVEKEQERLKKARERIKRINENIASLEEN